jgi:hypothetical protein
VKTFRHQLAPFGEDLPVDELQVIASGVFAILKELAPATMSLTPMDARQGAVHHDAGEQGVILDGRQVGGVQQFRLDGHAV